MLELSQFILGTAHIGNKYGLQDKKVSHLYLDELKIFFSEINDLGINYIDTALAYGQSQKLIGENLAKKDWHLQTKIFANRVSSADLKQDILSQICECRRALMSTKIHTILIHDAFELGDKKFAIVSQILDKLVLNGDLVRWGVSLYDTEDFFRLSNVSSFSVLQMPLNIIDQRVVSEGVVDFCMAKEIEFQARSIFLQGLLVSKQLRELCYFSRFNTLKEYEKFLNENKIDGLTATLLFLKNLGQNIRLVMGPRSVQEVMQILNTYSRATKDLCFANLASTNLSLVDPRFWKLK